MTLADAINMPLVAGLGLITIGPLTLLVTAIELLVFRFYLRTGLRTVIKRVLVANIISTLAGGLLLMFQDVIIHGTGIRESIPAFVRGYRWVGPLLIAVYFMKSVLVEGLWLTRRRFLEKIERRGSGVLRVVLVGNVFSYLIVGPLFYITTRPHFAGMETTFDASWTANPEMVVYYIDRDDEHVKRMQLNGQDAQTLIPFPAWSFLVSEDESTFAYVGTSGSLFAYRAGDKEPVLIRETDEGCFMTTVSLSPDNRRVAYLDPPQDEEWPYSRDAKETIKVFDLETHEVAALGTVPANDWGSPVTWSADGGSVYILQIDREYDMDGGNVESEQRTVYVFDTEPPFGLREKMTTMPPLSDLVVNYVRARGSSAYVGGRPMIIPPRHFEVGEYKVEVWPYLGSGIRVDGEGGPVLLLQNEYGLLNLSFPPIESALALPSGNEVLLEWWSQLYVLSIDQRKLGRAADGDQYVLRTPEFRVTFTTEGE